MISLVVLIAGTSTGAADLPVIHLEPYIKRSENLQRPVYLTNDGTDRNFVVEQPGRVRLIVDGKLQDAAYLNLTDRVFDQGECGLLSIAFHPDFATNGYLYANYTARRPKLQTVIAEYKADPTAHTVGASTERVVMTIDQPYANHNGGHILFGPDGMLYIGMGDGGSAGDPQNRAQNPRELLGKMLRIDVNHRDPYAIPKDNPYTKDARVHPEIWAIGLRNPWRFSFDARTGICFAGDVGQNAFEEVDVIEKGGNYGWRIFEASHTFKMVDDPPKTIAPIAEYPRSEGVSITGGLVYRGKKSPSLDGWYFYADYGSGRIWALKYEKRKKTAQGEVLRMRGQPSSFGVDASGEMYICDHSGAVLRIAEGK